jgi:cell division transport system permease protein
MSHRSSLAPLLDALRGLTMLTFGLVLLIAIASAAAVVLAARSALDSHRGTIEVMHGVGATDRQVTRLFLRQITIEALLGGAGGALAAGLVILLVIGGADMATIISGSPPLGWKDAVLLALVPLGIALLASLVARGALIRALRGQL